MALSQRIPLPFSVEMVEAMATRRATLFAQELSLSKVMLEDDCHKVVSALNSKDCCNTCMGMWLRRHVIKLVSFIFVGLHMCVGVGISWPTPSLEEQFHLLI